MNAPPFAKSTFALDGGSRLATLQADHPHDGPRTWIRGRMAPRRLRPAGFFCQMLDELRFLVLACKWLIAPRWIIRRTTNSGGVIFFPCEVAA